jgi:ketosteroid isomerase-like protein
MCRLPALLLAIPSLLVAQEPLRRPVDSLHAAMVAAFTADPASTARFYTSDAAVVSGGMRVVGREAVDNYWKSITAGATWKLEVLDVGGIPEAPWVHGRSTLTNAQGRVSLTEYIGLLQRGVDGQLRFRVDAYAGGAATAQPGDEAAVRKLDSLWASMYAKNDTASALQLYAPSLVFKGSDDRTKTLGDEMGDIRAAPGYSIEYFRSAPTTVKTFDRVAIVQGTAEWRFSMNGGAPRQIGRPYTAIYIRSGPLGWRIVAMLMGDGRVSRGRP